MGATARSAFPQTSRWRLSDGPSRAPGFPLKGHLSLIGGVKGGAGGFIRTLFYRGCQKGVLAEPRFLPPHMCNPFDSIDLVDGNGSGAKCLKSGETADNRQLLNMPVFTYYGRELHCAGNTRNQRSVRINRLRTADQLSVLRATADRDNSGARQRRSGYRRGRRFYARPRRDRGRRIRISLSRMTDSRRHGGRRGRHLCATRRRSRSWRIRMSLDRMTYWSRRGCWRGRITGYSTLLPIG